MSSQQQADLLLLQWQQRRDLPPEKRLYQTQPVRYPRARASRAGGVAERLPRSRFVLST